MNSSAYAAPATLDDAVSLLVNNPGARVLAGGQGLLVEPGRSRVAGHLVVDLRKIQQLAGVEGGADFGVTIGAMTTVATIAGSRDIRQAYPALAEAVRSTGDAQLRNRATIGGDLAGADPEGDLIAVMIALKANINIVGSQGSRKISATDLIAGAGTTTLRRDEIITSVSIASPAIRSASAYERVRHPATLAAICGVAANVMLTEDGRISAVGLGLTGAAEYPRQLGATEDVLTGQQITHEAIAAAANRAEEGLTFRGDLFASAEYRRHLTRVLTRRALMRAADLAVSPRRAATGSIDGR